MRNNTVQKKNCIIAGGGICGLFASILLADKFENVILIEKESQLGGLLKSISLDGGVTFDQGTHVPNTTMIPEIDDILFGREDERNLHWHDLGKLRSGNYFTGKWNLINQMLDVRNLPSEVYQKGIIELLSLTEQSSAEDIVTFLIETLGPTFTTEVVAPIAGKLYGSDVDLSTLVTNSSVSYFGLSRLLALDPIVSKKLKEIPAFDDKLAYHNEADFEERIREDKTPQRTNYYPKRGGVGYWVDHLIKQAKSKGVTLLTEKYIKTINYQEKLISSIELGSSGEIIDCDYLFWTVPPILALKAAKIEVKQRNLLFKSACIFHYQVDKPLLNTESHYVWNWDQEFKGFRVTLYPNMQKPDEKSLYRVSIEALCKPEEAEEITLNEMYEELVNIGLVDESSNIINQHKQIIHHTFPVPTFEFNTAVKKNYDDLSQAFDNIHIAGRFAGKSWFHEDVLKEVYFDIQNLV
ncbi:hypothetical protein CJF42_06450 [Pseudoalteromonas sp. NBT06-2]|uniref:NAD(P)-binding protein n=1 Tax=Pseudoalteromonas sp. NBT06-2 TaxID=2025950 RepID=UPI000BA780B3|nr:NAD(P)-binding protein [Pseudoalteromonas sp. NBT06-2]PAJ75127.1 hypothetical protein CJF42_06450 [Pseudoalteromonas sp. NBT06-2]